MGVEVKVASIPDCDICKAYPAYADARIPALGWGYVCRSHFDLYGCELGTGKGQRLVLR